MKVLRLAFALALAACAAPKSELPEALAEYRQKPYEVTPYEGRYVARVKLYRVTVVGIQDRSVSFVVGVDQAGNKIDGFGLFKRSLPLPPKEMAMRVQEFMLGEDRILEAGNVTGPFPPSEAALVKDPLVDDGKLVFWVSHGEMHPAIVRMTLDMTTGKMDRMAASQLLSAPAK